MKHGMGHATDSLGVEAVEALRALMMLGKSASGGTGKR
jgi:hypothetical protein